MICNQICAALRCCFSCGKTMLAVWGNFVHPHTVFWNEPETNLKGINVMGKRQKAWARTSRTRFLQMLGGRCAACGATDELEFDCIAPRGSRHHGMDTSQRISFYRAQMRMGNIQLLCTRCNALKGDLSQADWLALLTTVRNESSSNTHIKACGQVQQPPPLRSPRGNSEVIP